MMRRMSSFVLLAFAVAQAKGQDLVISDIHMAPEVVWPGSNNQLFAVQRTQTTTDGWQTVGFVAAPSDGAQSWVDSNQTAETPYSYRVELIPDTPGPFTEGFEDAEGWSNQLAPAWTSRVFTGTWSADGCYSVDNPSYTRESGRCMGFFDSSGHLDLPPVDYPTQIVYWARTLTGNDYFYMSVHTFDGLDWTSLGSRKFTSTNYETGQAPMGLSMKNQRLRLSVSGGPQGNALFVDNIQVFSKPPDRRNMK